jgi:N-acetylglucosaminyldiphosphoundecaprenol N-acetyl-beta-D-mannosaminyltransferase
MVDVRDAAQVGRIAEQLNAARPDLVLMALGAPKQELLIDQLAERVKPAVLLGIGASLDFIAGTVKRAPPLMRRAGLEWAYRLSQEPKRLWRRYLVDDPQFLAILWRTLLKRRARG